MLIFAGGVLAAETAPVSAQSFEVSPDGRAGMGVDDAIVAPDRQLTGRVVLQYVNDPLVYQVGDGPEVKAISDLLAVDLVAAYTMGRARLGFDIPFYVGTWGESAPGGGQLGDVAVDLRYSLLDTWDAPLGLGPSIRLALPTAVTGTALGSGGVDAHIGVVASRELGPWLLAANAGVHVLPQVVLASGTYGTQLALRAGVGRALGPGGLTGELDGGIGLDDPVSYATSPLEARVGGWYRVKSNLVLRAAVGTGLTRGIGSPDARVLLGAALEPSLERDTDHDGFRDPEDNCPAEPEDRDGFEDFDGCPDPDDDKDGIADAADRCPREPEDMDGWEDGDGCPEPETLVRFHVRDANGRSLPGARILLDARSLAGADTEAAFEPGSWGLRVEAPGYVTTASTVEVVAGPPVDHTVRLEPLPPPKPTATERVVITREKIEFYDSIYFDTGKATIKKESFSLLDEIARALREHPELRRVSIEGHTDSRGDAKKNRALSQARAESVMGYLAKAGVETGRLGAVGFGEDRPVAQGDDEAAWSKNRRVEFVITDRAP